MTEKSIFKSTFAPSKSNNLFEIKFQEYQQIRWIKNKTSKKSIEDSLNNLISPIKKRYKSEASLSKLKSRTLVDPKLIFTKEKYQLIMKLKDIFLEFDKDFSGKLDLQEIVDMFQTNKINIHKKDLTNLFFKGEKLNKEEEPHLKFFKFIQFAMSQASDQDFRNLMRSIKKRIKIRREKRLATQIFEKQNFQPNSQEEQTFLPMNFNLVLNYFNKKGKERNKISRIYQDLEFMKKYIKSEKIKGTIIDDEVNLSNYEDIDLDGFIADENDFNLKNCLEDFDELIKLIDVKKNETKNEELKSDKLDSLNFNKETSSPKILKTQLLKKKEHRISEIKTERSENRSINNNTPLIFNSTNNYFTDYFKRKVQAEKKTLKNDNYTKKSRKSSLFDKSTAFLNINSQIESCRKSNLEKNKEEKKISFKNNFPLIKKDIKVTVKQPSIYRTNFRNQFFGKIPFTNNITRQASINKIE